MTLVMVSTNFIASHSAELSSKLLGLIRIVVSDITLGDVTGHWVYVCSSYAKIRPHNIRLFEDDCQVQQSQTSILDFFFNFLIF